MAARVVDPEDDLPSADYAGDFETTAIPSYDSGSSRVGRSGYDDSELRYSPPHSDDIFSTDPAGPSDDEDSLFRASDQRGTQDLGLLLLRLGLGVALIAHGLQKLFGWWGGQGLGSFRKSLTDAGYQYADVLTYAGAGGQIVAGVLLVFGLFTPLAAAGALAYLLNAVLAGVSAQQGNRLSYFLPGAHEYQVLLVLVAIVVVLIGPGRYALDGDRGWARRPFIGSFVALLLGIAGGVALWVFLNGGNPLG